MTRIAAALIGLALAVSAGAARAAVIDLEDWAFNVDLGLVLPGDAIPGFIDVSAFDFNTGLGIITMTITGAGVHYAGVFVDHDIDDTAQQGANTFFNEKGSISGTSGAGQSWEIDAPGDTGRPGTLGIDPYIGDIVPNSDAGTLDNLVFFDNFDGQFLAPPDDVSMAMGFAIALAVDEIAHIDFILDTVQPAGGFYLHHTDPDSDPAMNPNIYFSGTLNISGFTVPEPATALLLGVAGLFALRRRRTR